MSGGAFAVTHHAFSSGAGRTSDGNGSHASTLKSPSYTKSVSWQHYPEFFPKSKAKVTSIYMMMGGLANFVIPLITGYLSNIGLQYIIVLDFTFALLALITAIIVFIRYYRVFIIPENDVRFGERKFCTRLNTIKHRG